VKPISIRDVATVLRCMLEDESPGSGDGVMDALATGQVFIRETGRTMNGKEVVMVAGIIGLPDASALKGERKYTVIGSPDGLRLEIIQESGEEQPQYEGYRIDQVMTAHDWRI